MTAARTTEIADAVAARQAERLLTLIGVPLLMLVIGGVASVLWNELGRAATRAQEAALLTQRVAMLELRLREETEATRSLSRELAGRTEDARLNTARGQTERDAAQDRQIAEIAAGLAAGREGQARISAQVEAARADLAEIKLILTTRGQRGDMGEPAPFAGAARRGGGGT